MGGPPDIVGNGHIWTKEVTIGDETKLLRVCIPDKRPFSDVGGPASEGFVRTDIECRVGRLGSDTNPNCPLCANKYPHSHVDQVDIGLVQP